MPAPVTSAEKRELSAAEFDWPKEGIMRHVREEEVQLGSWRELQVAGRAERRWKR